MAPATCNRERGPRPDPSRRWVALGTEASGCVAAGATLGWWLDGKFHSPLLLAGCAVGGVGVAFWILIRAARP